MTCVHRLDPGKGARWEVSAATGYGAAEAIALNATYCSDQGAICTEDGGRLSNRLGVTINGAK